MFDTLTPEELETLARKLHHAGHAFYEQADAIGSTALHLEKTGKITASSDAWNGFWALRAPIVDAMNEMHDLTAEADADARTRREVAPHDEGTSYCTSIPVRCPIHDA